MFNTRTFTYVLLASVASISLSGCAGNTQVLKPAATINVDKQEKIEKVDTFKVRAVPTGGIIMRRVNDPDFEAPQREVDQLRAYVAKLTNNLNNLENQSNALTGSVKKLQVADSKLLEERTIMLEILEEKFAEVEGRMTRADGESLKELSTQKQQLSQAIAQIKSQSKHLSQVRNAVSEGDALREELLIALDTKFAEIDETNDSARKGLTALEQKQLLEKEIRLAKEEAGKAAREERLVEELEFRKKLDNLRRSQVLQEERRLTAKEEEFKMQISKKRAVLEDKLAGAVKKIERLEIEEAHARKEQAERLLDQATEFQSRHEALQQLMQKRIDTLKAETAAERKVAVEAVGQQAERLQTFEKSMTDLKMEHIERLEEQSANFAKQQKRLEDIMQLRLSAIEEKRSNDLSEKAAKFSLEQERMQNEIAERLSALRLEHASKLIEIKSAHGLEREKLSRSIKLLETEVSMQDESFKLQSETLKTAMQQRINDLETAQAEKIKEMRAVAGAEREYLSGRVEELESEISDQRNLLISQEEMLAAMQDASFEGEITSAVPSHISSASGTGFEIPAIERYKALETTADQWIDLRDYNIVVHASEQPLDALLKSILSQAEPYVGPWDVKWKLKEEHRDVLGERFSLDVETEFSKFTSYLSTYMQSYRGFGLTFNLFESDRVLVITDQ